MNNVVHVHNIKREWNTRIRATPLLLLRALISGGGGDQNLGRAGLKFASVSGGRSQVCKVFLFCSLQSNDVARKLTHLEEELRKERATRERFEHQYT